MAGKSNDVNDYFAELAGLGAAPTRHGGRRPGAGRKPGTKSGMPMSEIKVFVDDETLTWLAGWNPSNRSDAVRQVLERARKMWPEEA